MPAKNKSRAEPGRCTRIGEIYPLARRLVIALRPAGKDGLPPLEREFLRFVLSRQGQQVVVKDGYFPLTYDVVAAEAKRAGMVLAGRGN
jgi:phosphate transport system substrate-binding protein